MTDQPLAAAFGTRPSQSFATARNDWLNAFARLELEIGRCIHRVSETSEERGRPLAQRLKTLAATKASPRCSKAETSRLPDLCAASEQLLSLRASLVHSIMVEGRRENEPVAFFQNVSEALAQTTLYHVFSNEDFERTRKEVTTLAATFARFPRACAPPRPKPGAAAGP